MGAVDRRDSRRVIRRQVSLPSLRRVTAELHRVLADRLGVGEGDASRATVLRVLGRARTTRRADPGRPRAARPGPLLGCSASTATCTSGSSSAPRTVSWSSTGKVSPACRLRSGRGRGPLCATSARCASHSRTLRAPRTAATRGSTGAPGRWPPAREAFDAYARGRGRVDGELLHALELEKELAELTYAERWLPEWLYAPAAVLPFILDEAA